MEVGCGAASQLVACLQATTRPARLKHKSSRSELFSRFQHPRQLSAQLRRLPVSWRRHLLVVRPLPHGERTCRLSSAAARSTPTPIRGSHGPLCRLLAPSLGRSTSTRSPGFVPRDGPNHAACPAIAPSPEPSSCRNGRELCHSVRSLSSDLPAGPVHLVQRPVPGIRSGRRPAHIHFRWLG